MLSKTDLEAQSELKDSVAFRSKTVASIFGEIIWLMSRSVDHRNLTVAALEELVMPAVLLRQFRIFYDAGQPAAVVLYARVSADVSQKIKQNAANHPLTFMEWQSGPVIHIVLAVSPFGCAEQFIKETIHTAQIHQLEPQSTPNALA